MKTPDQLNQDGSEGEGTVMCNSAESAEKQKQKPKMVYNIPPEQYEKDNGRPADNLGKSSNAAPGTDGKS